MSVVREGLTLAEFLALPEQEPPLEYFHGRVTQKVSPQPEHGALQFALGVYLLQRLGDTRLGRVFTETRAVFGGASFVPDLSFYRWERIPRRARGRIGGPGEQPPNLVVEILSPGQSVADLVERCAHYVAHGAQVALLLEPSAENIWVFRPDRLRTIAHGAEPIDLQEVAPGLVLIPGEIFAALDLDDDAP
jgi:Uma2 family endonuclease